jgi:hypothetical protein
MNTRSSLILTLTLFCATGAAMAQTQAPPSGASSAPSAEPQTSLQSAPKTYRLTYTVSEIDGTHSVGTQHYSMTADADGRASVKLGSKIPVLTGEYNPGSSQTQTQFTYIDVGLNLDMRLKEFANGVQVIAKVEKSNVADEPSTLEGHEPIIRQEVLQNTAVVTLGKPIMLGSLDIPGSTHHLDIGLVVEAVR